jgi:tetratricopeptide (TPR) repeat protein
MFLEVAQHWRTGDYQKTADILRRAHRLAPTNEKVLLELGFAHAMSYDFAEAERWFETAIRVSSSKTQTLLAVGHQWQKVRHYEVARGCFERILQQKDVPILALLRLAEIYERQRRMNDAVAMAERALHMDGTDAGALLTRATIHRQMKQLEDAEKLLRLIVDNPTHHALHTGAWYELGNILDLQGRYDDAMAAFLKAKILSPALAKNAAQAATKLRTKQASLKEMQNTISESLLQRWRSAGESGLQPPRKLALLCGHARSGTTLLEYVVDSHPQITSADETFVFTNKVHLLLGRGRPSPPPALPTLDSISAGQLRQFRNDYFRGMESFLGQPIENRLLIDKNPGITSDLPAFFRAFPESKFLVALRDPRDVCLSCFMQPARINPDSSSWLSLEGTINNYASIMDFWRAMKPLLGNAAIEIRYEDMVQDLESNARRVLDFLGLAWDERVLKFNEHAQTKIVRSPTYVEVTKPIFKSAVGRWRNYQKYFEPHLAQLASSLKAFGYE